MCVLSERDTGRAIVVCIYPGTNLRPPFSFVMVEDCLPQLGAAHLSSHCGHSGTIYPKQLLSIHLDWYFRPHSCLSIPTTFTCACRRQAGVCSMVFRPYQQASYHVVDHRTLPCCSRTMNARQCYVVLQYPTPPHAQRSSNTAQVLPWPDLVCTTALPPPLQHFSKPPIQHIILKIL